MQLPFPCSSPSWPGNEGELGSQAPLTLCNLRIDPCVCPSEVERSGISLAGLLHITQWKLYFLLCQTFFFFLKLLGHVSLSFSLAVVYGYAHVQIWIHRQRHMWTLKGTNAGNSDLHGNFHVRFALEGWAQTQTVCCNNTVTWVYSVAVIRALVCCCLCQPMHLSSQQNYVVGWWQSCHMLI